MGAPTRVQQSSSPASLMMIVGLLVTLSLSWSSVVFPGARAQNGEITSYNCDNTQVAPTGIVPKDAVGPYVIFFNDTESGIADPSAFIISLCNKTAKTPKATQNCADTSSFYAARWHAKTGVCENVYDGPVAAKVSDTKYTITLQGVKDATRTLIVVYECGIKGDRVLSTSGNVDTLTLFTDDSTMCPPAPTPQPPPPPPPPSPEKTPQPNNNNGNPDTSNSDDESGNRGGDTGNDGLSGIAIFLIVVGVAAVSVLIAVIVDLKRRNSMLRRIVRGPDSVPTQETETYSNDSREVDIEKRGPDTPGEDLTEKPQQSSNQPIP